MHRAGCGVAYGGWRPTPNGKTKGRARGGASNSPARRRKVPGWGAAFTYESKAKNEVDRVGHTVPRCGAAKVAGHGRRPSRSEWIRRGLRAPRRVPQGALSAVRRPTPSAKGQAPGRNDTTSSKARVVVIRWSLETLFQPRGLGLERRCRHSVGTCGARPVVGCSLGPGAWSSGILGPIYSLVLRDNIVILG